ncbi:PHD-finger family protein [Histomonas meleagridis]|uniref:PHD-finger family protein n=1 Tax=Histomonas meleagridis TaxID=135588 RepID=UPI00355A904C|nr:PHD-finger family protein [Histomonas meleagridis]KAH0799437.1 PHD-finger family protein [Histomonas meleagridis]
MEEVVNCFCSDDEDDGIMVGCEVCHKWQHAECVNINNFNMPEHYVCPRCRHIEIVCKCEVEGDHQRCLIQCQKCGKFQHKRHTFIGIGNIPKHYVCCFCNRTSTFRQKKEIKPIFSFYPNMKAKVTPRNPLHFAIHPPSGPLISYFKEFTAPIEPPKLIAKAYSEFKEIFFIHHPFINFFEYETFHCIESVEDTYTFSYFFVRLLSYMLNISSSQVILVLNHIISTDIYDRPIPKCYRTLPINVLPQISMHKQNLKFSERAETGLEQHKNAYVMKQKIKLPELVIELGPCGYPTVVSKSDIKNNDFITEIFGNVTEFEELDRNDSTPSSSAYMITDTNTMIDSTMFENNAIYTHIQRGFTSNCEVRYFKLNGKMRVGLFATHPTILPYFGRKSTKSANDEIVIHAGEELFLPFDITPTLLRKSVEWRDEKPQRIDYSIDYFLPPPVGEHVDYNIVLPNEKSKDTKLSQDKESDIDYTLNDFFGGNTDFSFEIKQTNAEMFPLKIDKVISLPTKMRHKTPINKFNEKKRKNIWYKDPYPSVKRRQNAPKKILKFWDIDDEPVFVEMEDKDLK